MKVLFLLGFFFWVGVASSSMDEDKAQDILDTVSTVSETAIETFQTVREKAQDQMSHVPTTPDIDMQPYITTSDVPQLVTQSMCVARSDLMIQLQQDYQEKPFLVGRNDDGRLLEVMRSHNGTFSVVSTDNSGNACLLASGNGAETLKAASSLTIY